MNNADSKVLNDGALSGQATAPHSGSGVGLAHKEQAPISSRVVSEISQIIDAPEVPTEARETVTAEMPSTRGHKAVGIKHAGEPMPVDANKTLGAGQLPTIEEVKENLTQPTSNSGRWFAELAKKILKRFGLWKGK